MEILFIEPFYTGSHKQFANQLQHYSNHNIKLMTMDGKFWKWRMHGAAIYLSKEINTLKELPDLILASDMLDVATFMALTRQKLVNIPIITYFHENQFSYPLSEENTDPKTNRDTHYGMINYQSALASDFNLFNSYHNMNTFFQGLETTLKKMPDYAVLDTIPILKQKSEVLYLGLDLFDFNKPLSPIPTIISDIINPDLPTILWNHRLEHDKNPQLFFELLIRLQEEKIPFQLLLLGEQTKKNKKKYQQYLVQLDNQILFEGSLSNELYHQVLRISDLLPVTSCHDTFGIAIAEAIYAGVKPLLPKALSYPELYNPSENPELFYLDSSDLYQKLKDYCMNFTSATRKEQTSYSHLVSKFHWNTRIQYYDDFFRRWIK